MQIKSVGKQQDAERPLRKSAVRDAQLVRRLS